LSTTSVTLFAGENGIRHGGHQRFRHAQDRLGFFDDRWLCLTYIGAVLLLLAARPAWTRRLALFGHAGRMALTNYIAQVVIVDLLASGYGAGLRLRPLLYLPAGVLLFTLLALASRAWLTRFRMGPLEWAWRCLTYGRLQPLVRGMPSASVGSPL
jgi:uncharacterized protein